MWFILALLSGFCAAVLAILVKLYLQHHNPFFVTFIFSIISILMFFVFDLFTKKINCALITSLTLQDWVPLIAAGCLNGLAFTCYLSALKCGNACGVVALDRFGIVFAVILAALFLKEAFTVKAMIGALLMIVGAVLLSW